MKVWAMLLLAAAALLLAHGPARAQAVPDSAGLARAGTGEIEIWVPVSRAASGATWSAES